MRAWVEKLAKKLEEKGYTSHGWNYIVEDFTMFITERYVSIRKKDSEIYSYIKIYEDEEDLLKKAADVCTKRTEDYMINTIENL